MWLRQEHTLGAKSFQAFSTLLILEAMMLWWRTGNKARVMPRLIKCWLDCSALFWFTAGHVSYFWTDQQSSGKGELNGHNQHLEMVFNTANLHSDKAFISSKAVSWGNRMTTSSHSEKDCMYLILSVWCNPSQSSTSSCLYTDQLC